MTGEGSRQEIGEVKSGTLEEGLRTDTFTLAAPEGRWPGTAGHDRAREYLEGRFEELALESFSTLDGFRHSYRVSRALTMTNLIGVIPGSDRTLPPLLIGAHYDSVIAAPCAGDNAAGVAVMLHVAARLASRPLRRDVIIAAFDAEEPPHYQQRTMGSTRFVEDVLDRPVHLAVILDLVGHPVRVPGVPLDPHLMFVVGAESHPALPGLLGDLSLPIGATTQARVDDMSDYRAFRLSGAPYLFFSCGEWSDYHQATDLPDRLDYAKMAKLVGDLETVIRRADHVHTDYGGRLEDTTDFEVAALEAALGPEILNALAAMSGRTDYRSAADHDVIVRALRGALR